MVVDSYAEEFGYELIRIVPYAYWLHQKGELEKTISAIDTESLYYFSPNHEEKYLKRVPTIQINHSKFPIKNIHVPELDKSKWEAPPYKEIYKNPDFVFDKPMVIIMNKYATEWNGPPRNFLSYKMIETLFDYLTPNYQVIYNRADKHTSDEVTQKNLNEKGLIRKKYPEVILFEDLFQKYKDRFTFNTLQMLIYANCDNYISVQGGFSVLASYFAKKNFIYATAGNEVKVGSYKWYNEFAGSEIHHHNNYVTLLKDIKENL
jgi:hypothetical protein